MVIILIGYMGSGKSTVGRKLAIALGFDYVDLDEFIQLREGVSISELFRSKGEIYFRKVESKYLKEILMLESTVVSLGGGTPCYGNNMQLITSESKAKSIYLKASIPTLVNRLRQEKSKRPLIDHLETDTELTEFIGKHLFERSVYYSQVDVSMQVDDKASDDIVEEILLELF